MDAPSFNILNRSIFSGSDCQRLAGYLQIREAKPGEVLFNEGDQGTFLGIVISGSVDISVRDGGKETKLATLVPAQSFGEMSVIDDGPRSATARAGDPCRYLRLSGQALKRMRIESPGLYSDVADRIMKTLSRRVRESNEVRGLGRVIEADVPKELRPRTPRP